MDIRSRLICLASISIVFLAIIGVSSSVTVRKMVDTANRSTIGMEAMRNQMEADMMHDALRGDVLAAALASSGGQAERRAAIEKDLREHVENFRKALKDNEALDLPADIANAVAKVRPLLDAYIEEGTGIVALAFDEPGELDARMSKFMDAFAALETEMEALSELIAKNTAESAGAANDAAVFAQDLIVAALAAAVSSLAVLSFLIVRSILGSIRQVQRAVDSMNSGEADLTFRLPPLNGEFAAVGNALNRFIGNLQGIMENISNATEAVATASSQIAAGNQDLAARTESEASSLEETASSMEELMGTVNQNAANAAEANRLTESAAAIAVKGGAVVSRVVDMMGEINTASRKIADIIGVIDGIAFQTNILALNAAVEAARAGEQGRGFAVVAAEVRSLAQRSATAAREVRDLIDDSVQKVDGGSLLVEEAGATMHEMVDSVRHVTCIVADIAGASREQASGIKQVRLAIGQIDGTTQQNASLVEEVATAAAALYGQTEKLAQAVGVFKLAEETARPRAGYGVDCLPVPRRQAVALVTSRTAR